MSSLTVWVGLIGLVLGYGFSEWKDYRQRKRITRGHFEALKAEIRIGGYLAAGYVTGRVLAPAYRLPMIAYNSSLPALLAHGVLSEEEAEALLKFYVNAESLNLCLGLTQGALGDEEAMKREAGRGLLKASKGVSGQKLYDDALAAVLKHLPPAPVRELELPIGETPEKLMSFGE